MPHIYKFWIQFLPQNFLQSILTGIFLLFGVYWCLSCYHNYLEISNRVMKRQTWVSVTFFKPCTDYSHAKSHMLKSFHGWVSRYKWFYLSLEFLVYFLKVNKIIIVRGVLLFRPDGKKYRRLVFFFSASTRFWFFSMSLPTQINHFHSEVPVVSLLYVGIIFSTFQWWLTFHT